MSDLTVSGTGYSFVPSSQISAASITTWIVVCAMVLAGGLPYLPQDNNSPLTMTQMSPANLTGLVNTGLLTSP